VPHFGFAGLGCFVQLLYDKSITKASGSLLTLMAPPNVLRFSCRLRRAAQHSIKKRTISRAEGGQLQAPVGRQLASAFHLRMISGPT